MLKKRITVLLAGALLASASSFGLDIITFNGAEVSSDSVIVRLKNHEAGQVQALAVGSAQIRYRSTLVPGLLSLKRPQTTGGLQALSVEDKAVALQHWIDDLKASGQFEYVEPDFIRRIQRVPKDLRFADGTLWGLENHGQNGGLAGNDISATNAWDLTVGSTNVIVAVVDTGVRYTHKDLAAQMWHNPGEIPGNGADDDNDGLADDVFGADFVDNDGDPNDTDGHGTHVAGTIAAAANDGNPHVGVAWKAQIMAVRVLTEQGGTDTDLARGLQYAADHGARIVNMSLGGPGFGQALFDAMNALRAKGVLAVCAAGNDGTDNDVSPNYPASFNLDNIIAVAAMDRRGLLATFSNFGKKSVHVAAPGVEIYSTFNGSDTDYQVLQGTSMATPHVTGVAALVAAYVPGASYQEIRSRIFDGVVQVPTFTSKLSTGGRVNAYRALTRGVDGVLEYSIVPPSNSSLTIGSSTVFSLNLSDGPVVTNAAVNLSGGGTNLVLRYDAATNSAVSSTAGTYTNTYVVPDSEGALSFTLTAAAPGKTNLSVQLTYQAVARPANDNFANAIKVPFQQSWSQATSNRNATIEGAVEQGLAHGGRGDATASIWYAWSLPQRTPVIVDTAGSTFDTVIGVYRGTALTNLELVAQADNIGSRKEAWVKFVAEPNVSYKIAVAGVPPSDQGLVQVRFEQNGEPDTTSPVVQITSPVSGLTFTTNKVEVRGTAFDPLPNASGLLEAGVQFAVSTNQQVNPSTLPRSAKGSTNWVAPVDLQEGVNFVTVWAFDSAENRSVNQQISIIYRPSLISSNDLFYYARALTLDQVGVSDSNVSATKEFGEPAHGGNAGGKSIWYSFTPTQSGVFLVNTRGSTNTATSQPLDTVMSVYVSTNTTAPKVTTLDQLASNDDVAGAGVFSEITLTVEAGKTYYIGVDGYDGAAGTIQLNYAFSPSKIYQVTVLPSQGDGTVSPRSGPFPANATLSIVARPSAAAAFQYFDVAGTQIRQNPYTFVVSSNVAIKGVFAARTFAEDFEGGAFKLPFVTTNWAISLDPTNRLNHVLQSPGNGLNRITNIASLLIRGVAGSGAFDYGTSTETNYDRLEFYITPMEAGKPTNTVFLGGWSGESRGRYQFVLPDGLVRLEWRYVKDRAISGGSDLVFIDNIDLPQAGVVSALSLANQTTTLNVKGGAGQTFLLETSTDLVQWSEVGMFQASDSGDLTFTEPAKGARRFYRTTPIQSGTP